MWAPQPGPQAEAISADWCDEVFYGGAAGGGKSDFLLGDFLQDVPTYEAAWRGVLFRRTTSELEELQARALEIFPSYGARYIDSPKRRWTWPNGASLKLRFLEADRDATRYQGHQYTWIGFDELTQWKSLYAYRYLRGRLRSAHRVPTKRIRAAANPGGAGHLEVKAYFIDPAPAGFKPIDDPVTGKTRMFVPAKLEDNQILVANDPGYEGNLLGLGGHLARAMRDGDWNIIVGAFFDGWAARNVITPFEIPGDWTRFRSFDWGSAKPFSVGWWAVAGEDGPGFARGALIRYREWYGSNGEPNVGLKLQAEAVAEGIKDRERGEAIKYGVADPAIFTADGGPSIAERMHGRGITWRRADNARVSRGGAMGGWDVMRARIEGTRQRSDRGEIIEPGVPMLVVFSTCGDFIRTVPVLQHDATRPEDLDTDMEDHVADEARYACMSRPWAAKSVAGGQTHVLLTPTGARRVPVVEERRPTYAEIMARQPRRPDRV